MKRRLRGIAKWMATAALLASASAWCFSHWYDAIFLPEPFVDVRDGVVSVEWQSPFWPRSRFGRYMVMQNTGQWGLVPPTISSRVECKAFCDGTTIWPGTPTTYTTVVLPMWVPTLLSCCSCIWLWKSSPSRSRPGYCVRCRYDLTGNTSGICSECGLAIAPPGARKPGTVEAPTKTA